MPLGAVPEAGDAAEVLDGILLGNNSANIFIDRFQINSEIKYLELTTVEDTKEVRPVVIMSLHLILIVTCIVFFLENRLFIYIYLV